MSNFYSVSHDLKCIVELMQGALGLLGNGHLDACLELESASTCNYDILGIREERVHIQLGSFHSNVLYYATSTYPQVGIP